MIVGTNMVFGTTRRLVICCIQKRVYSRSGLITWQNPLTFLAHGRFMFTTASRTLLQGRHGKAEHLRKILQKKNFKIIIHKIMSNMDVKLTLNDAGNGIPRHLQHTSYILTQRPRPPPGH
jgi:hypothetical protein